MNNSQHAENIPVALHPPEPGPTEPVPKGSNSDRTVRYAIGALLLFSCCCIFAVGCLLTLAAPIRKLFETPTDQQPSAAGLATPHPTSIPTNSTWSAPAESPKLGTAFDVILALKDKNIKDLKSYASYLPNLPEINTPGDVYFYGVRLDSSRPALWNYLWCTSTTKILDQNFDQMKVDFFVNEKPVSPFAILARDSQKSRIYFCRTHYALITSWPPGIHKLEIKVTFVHPTDDGWNRYPAGTHTFQYLVTVK